MFRGVKHVLSENKHFVGRIKGPTVVYMYHWKRKVNLGQINVS